MTTIPKYRFFLLQQALICMNIMLICELKIKKKKEKGEKKSSGTD